MTKPEAYIHECEQLLAEDPYKFASRSQLATAIADAQKARARLCDVKNKLAEVILGIEHVLEDDDHRLPGHGINDDRYGKIETYSAAVGFRQAMERLHQVRISIDLAVGQHIRLLRDRAA